MSQSRGQTSWLRVARDQRNLSMRDLQELSGVAIAAISKIETGRTATPTPRTKRDLANALGYDVEDVFPSSGRTQNRELREWARALEGAN